ncbi:Bax inhibitor-1/YccA family protein [Bacteroidota bacterium]
MRLYRSSNPAISGRIFENAVNQGTYTDSMTITGTINKVALLIFLVIAGASYTWRMVMSENPTGAQTYVMIGAIGGLILAMVTIFRPRSASITAPLYAILEGLFLGGISAMINVKYQGIPFQAVLLTLGTLFAMLFLYRSGRLRATPKFRRGVFMATGAIFFSYLISFVFSLFGVNLGFMHSAGPIGILINLVILVVAALNLILDFDFIERGSNMGAPKYMEWYGAFGLIVTLVWLYIEFLRLLSRFAGRN